jgi:hypothetical protein
MNRFAFLIVSMMACVALAACGGGNNATGGGGGNAAHNEGGEGGEHAGHHHEGEEHDLGKKSQDGFDVEVTQIGDPKGGGELVFEVKVTKDGKASSEINITAHIADKDQKGGTAPKGGTWVEDEQGYDCHVMLPDELKGDEMLWIDINHGESTVSFDIAKE